MNLSFLVSLWHSLVFTYSEWPHKTIPQIVQDDELFYELLTIIDTIRVGRVREVKIAIDELNKRLKDA
jgi:hypothetical protein